MSEKLIGKVKKYIQDRGFGFVEGEENPGTDIFFHVTDTDFGKRGENIEEGTRISYETMIATDGRMKAINITKLHHIMEKLDESKDTEETS